MLRDCGVNGSFKQILCFSLALHIEIEKNEITIHKDTLKLRIHEKIAISFKSYECIRVKFISSWIYGSLKLKPNAETRN